MADIITNPMGKDKFTLTGSTRNPDHDWSIRLGPAGHCYLSVDGEYVHHGTMETCTKYLLNL